jgi:hypothetical protein
VILHGVFLKHHKKAFWSFKYISGGCLKSKILRQPQFFYFSFIVAGWYSVYGTLAAKNKKTALSGCFFP